MNSTKIRRQRNCVKTFVVIDPRVCSLLRSHTHSNEHFLSLRKRISLVHPIKKISKSWEQKILSNEFSVRMNYCNILKKKLTLHYNFRTYVNIRDTSCQLNSIKHGLKSENIPSLKTAVI